LLAAAGLFQQITIELMNDEQSDNVSKDTEQGQLRQAVVVPSALFRPRTFGECCKALGNGTPCEVRSHLVYKCLAAWSKGRLRVKVGHGKYHAGWAALEPF